MTIFPLLTDRQALMWSLKLKGLDNISIARKLKISRQAVSKALSIAELKIVKSLLEVAKASKIEVRNIIPNKSILIGYSYEFNREAIITFSTSNGIYVWYRNHGNCKSCPLVKKCKEILIREANERGIILNNEEINLPPSKLAEIIFRKIGVIS